MPNSEFSLIQRYFSAYGRGDGVDLSVGDDCALLQLEANERLATSVDTMVEGVHFPAETFPEDVGYRAVAAAASDLAAMGARPVAMTLALALPEVDELWLHAFSQGLAAAGVACGLPLVGGDTTRGPLTITVSVLGALPKGKALLRDGALPGNGIYVSGTLGDAAAALSILEGHWQPAPGHVEYLLGRFNRPAARLELGRALLLDATAAIDISDGLLADAGHIAAASGVQMRIESGLLPLSAALQSHPAEEVRLTWALTGGDDYELCFCLPEGAAVPAGCTCIGRVAAGTGVHCDFAMDSAPGFRHF